MAKDKLLKIEDQVLDLIKWKVRNLFRNKSPKKKKVSTKTIYG